MGDLTFLDIYYLIIALNGEYPRLFCKDAESMTGHFFNLSTCPRSSDRLYQLTAAVLGFAETCQLSHTVSLLWTPACETNKLDHIANSCFFILLTAKRHKLLQYVTYLGSILYVQY